MRKFLVLLGVAAIAFGVVGVAAASLTVTTTQPLPQQGTVASITAACATTATVAYKYDAGGTNVMTVDVVVTPTDSATTGTACDGSTVALSLTNSPAVTVEAAKGIGTSSGSPKVYTVNFTLNSTSGIAITDFSPSAIAVTVYK